MGHNEIYALKLYFGNSLRRERTDVLIKPSYLWKVPEYPLGAKYNVSSFVVIILFNHNKDSIRQALSLFSWEQLVL